MIKVIITLCFILGASQLFSQTNYKEKIDRFVGEIDANISGDSDSHTMYMVHEIKFETNKRAIGKQYTSVKFYYPMPGDSVVESDAGTEFLYIYKPPVKVSVSYNVAASQDFVNNYYFDDTSLVFCSFFSSGQYGALRERYYFDKGSLIRYETHTPDNDYIKEEFRQFDLNAADKIVKRAQNYLKTFYELVKVEQLDKE